MSQCCDPSSDSPTDDSAESAPCPACRLRGLPVTIKLLKHQLRPEHLDAVAGHDRFHFCAEPACDVVYFAHDGYCFGTADLRVHVTQKASGPDRPLCYCFGFIESMVREEIAQTGRCTIPERIKAEIKAGHCACEIRNPQGTCCLGNVMAVVNALLVRPT